MIRIFPPPCCPPWLEEKKELTVDFRDSNKAVNRHRKELKILGKDEGIN